MRTILRAFLRSIWLKVEHFLGKINGKYYVEDFVRVYPDAISYGHFGRKHESTPIEMRNYLNHQKFYRFAAQFVRGAKVADIGCGSGYGSAILKEGGASLVAGTDVSKHSIDFARKHFSDYAVFSEQSITNLSHFDDESFDVAVSSEVLEHILDYGKEDVAVAEIKRITRPGGIVIIATPNTELPPEDHGFSFQSIDALMKRHFHQYCIFENALLPFGNLRSLWERRLAHRQTGIMVTQDIDFDETIIPEGVMPEIKRGLEPGVYRLGRLEIDTRLLHNTHSWVILAIK